MPSEKDLRKKMVDRIRGLPRSWANATHQGPHSPSVGEPDVLACVEGIMLQVEVKLPGNRPTRVQTTVIRRWRRTGAVAGWANSMDHLEELLALIPLVKCGAEIVWPEELEPGYKL